MLDVGIRFSGLCLSGVHQYIPQMLEQMGGSGILQAESLLFPLCHVPFAVPDILGGCKGKIHPSLPLEESAVAMTRCA